MAPLPTAAYHQSSLDAYFGVGNLVPSFIHQVDVGDNQLRQVEIQQQQQHIFSAHGQTNAWPDQTETMTTMPTVADSNARMSPVAGLSANAKEWVPVSSMNVEIESAPSARRMQPSSARSRAGSNVSADFEEMGNAMLGITSFGDENYQAEGHVEQAKQPQAGGDLKSSRRIEDQAQQKRSSRRSRSLPRSSKDTAAYDPRTVQQNMIQSPKYEQKRQTSLSQPSQGQPQTTSQTQTIAFKQKNGTDKTREEEATRDKPRATGAQPVNGLELLPVPHVLEVMACRGELLPGAFQLRIRSYGAELSVIKAPDSWESSAIFKTGNNSRKLCVRLRFPNNKARELTKGEYERHKQNLLRQNRDSGVQSGIGGKKIVLVSQYAELNNQNILKRIQVDSGCASVNAVVGNGKKRKNNTIEIIFVGSQPAMQCALRMLSEYLKTMGSKNDRTAAESASSSPPLTKKTNKLSKILQPLEDDGRVWRFVIGNKKRQKGQYEQVFKCMRSLVKLDRNEAKHYEELYGQKKRMSQWHTTVGLESVLKDIRSGICAVVVVGNPDERANKITTDRNVGDLSIQDCILRAMRTNASKASKGAAYLKELHKKKEEIKITLKHADTVTGISQKNARNAGPIDGTESIPALSKNAIRNIKRKLKDIELQEGKIRREIPKQASGTLIVGLDVSKLLEIEPGKLDGGGAVLSIRTSPFFDENQAKRTADTSVVTSYISTLAEELNCIFSLTHKYGEDKTSSIQDVATPLPRATADVTKSPNAAPVIKEGNNCTFFNVAFLDPEQPIGWDFDEDKDGRIIITQVCVFD